MKRDLSKNIRHLLGRGSKKPGRKVVQPTVLDLPKIIPPGGSYLAAETQAMENARRRREQQGERNLAKVHALEHPDDPVQGNEEGYENTLQEHPELKNSQRLDGVDNTVIPQLTDRDARREYDNEKRKQQAEKQLKLGLAIRPNFSSTPRPPGT